MSSTDWIYKETAKLLFAILMITVMTLYVGRFFGLYMPVDEEGAEGQIKAITTAIQKIKAQLDLTLEEMQEGQQENIIEIIKVPIQLKKQYMLAFFANGEMQITDTCKDENKKFFEIGTCQDDETIQRDIGCGKKPCVCLYKEKEGIRSDKTCVRNYQPVMCRSLLTDDLRVNKVQLKAIYGECESQKGEIKEITITMKKENQEYIASISEN
ncbi:hypothetical protein HY486_02795 [Candidatus Woesearchaeota archaeon]|nr:hypothetical protein [Candidatus Woesearchaeota archaeon]